MEYYKIMQLSDMIESELVLPSQYIAWADKVILSTDKPDCIILELCVERSPKKARDILSSALSKMDYPQNNNNEYYSWERENYYIGYLYLCMKYHNVPLNIFLMEAGYYSDGMNTQWSCEKFFSLAHHPDDKQKIEIFLNEWSGYVNEAEKIYLSFKFD